MENENQILLLLGEIKGQISGFMSGLADVKGRTDDHDIRIRAIETKNSKQAGVVLGITAVASVAATAVSFIAQLVLGH